MSEPESDFLDWCIDNSFEVDELSSSTKKKLNVLKSNPMPEKHIQIYHFKKIVENNFAIKMFKYIGIAVLAISIIRYFLK